jgi:hypothetical protein
VEKEYDYDFDEAVLQTKGYYMKKKENGKGDNVGMYLLDYMRGYEDQKEYSVT